MEGGLFQKSFDEEWRIESYIFQNYQWIIDFPKSWHLPVTGSVGYLSFIYFGQKYMKTRTRFELRIPMLLWSLFLAVFSWLALWRVSVNVLEHVFIHGFRKTVCIQNCFNSQPIYRFWGLAMMYSKYAEYVDTIFIVLRKQNLQFLHWYHHLSVSVYCWYNNNSNQPGGYIFCGMNFAVHAVMYTYYSLKAAKLNPLKSFAIFITFLQTTQMFIGCIVMGGMVYWANDSDCQSSVMQRVYGILMYASYLILFIIFFHGTYIRKAKTKKGC